MHRSDRKFQFGFVFIAVMLVSATACAKPDQLKPWTTPKALLESLAELESLPAVSVWAKETRELVEATIQPDLYPLQRSNFVKQLARQRDLIDSLNTKVWQSELADQQRREISSRLFAFGHQLDRRLATWSALAQLSEYPDAENSLLVGQYRPIDFSDVDAEWSEYLLLQKFRDVFENADSTDKEKRQLARKILGRIYSPVLRTDQSDYVGQLVHEDVIDFLRAHASRIVSSSDLATRLELYERQPSSRAGFYLDDVHQDLLWSRDPSYQRAAQTIEMHYRNANFRLTVSQRLMNRLLPELPTIAEPVSEVVQGAQVSGQSRTSNRLNVSLVPDDQQLNFQIQTNGHVRSDTVAKTRAFRILNQGQANFLVTKQISLGRNGFDTSHQAYSNSTAKQVLVDIRSKVDNVPLFGMIARRAAEKRVRESNPETTQLFRRKVAKQAEIRVEQELNKQIDKVRAVAVDNLLNPLVSMDLDPVPMQLATTDSQITIRYRLAGRDQMAANTPRPAGDPRALLGFQLHQSLINNAIARLGLNGETFTGSELVKHLEETIGLTAKQQTAPPEHQVKIKFAKLDPIRIDFKSDRINFVVNLDSLKIDDSKTLRKISMTVSYGIQADGIMIKLSQDDTGTRVTGKRLRLGERAKISTIMNLLFEQAYTINALPKKFRSKPKVHSLAVSDLVVNNGWLSLSFDEFRSANQPSDGHRTGYRVGDNVRRMIERR